MKKIMLVLLCMFGTTVAKATTTSDDHNHDTTKVSAKAMMKAAKTETKFLKVNPGEVYGFKYYPEEMARIQQAFKTIEIVINSEEFKNEVIAYSGYTSTGGLSNKEIYDAIMSGKEILGGESTLGEMNFRLARYYKRWSKVIGYSSPGKNDWIMLNGKFYKGFVVSQIASNITHEWLHLSGFYHPGGASEHTSVPYAVGYIMERLAQKYDQQGFLD